MLADLQTYLNLHEFVDSESTYSCTMSMILLLMFAEIYSLCYSTSTLGNYCL